MESNGGRRDVTIHAPAAVVDPRAVTPGARSAIKAPAPDVQAQAAAQGITMAPQDVIAAQQAQIRELAGELEMQKLAASNFANLIAALVSMIDDGEPWKPEHGTAIVARGLIDHFDGAKIALQQLAGDDVQIKITERLD